MVTRFLGLCLGLALFSGCAHKPAGHPEEPQVRAFLTRYFETWSSQDIAGYESCFHPQSRVFLLEDDGKVVSLGLTDFIHSQRIAHAQSSTPMKEVAVDTHITMDSKGAQAYVNWLLTKGREEKRGVDLFTLKKEATGWKIVSLTFYGD